MLCTFHVSEMVSIDSSAPSARHARRRSRGGDAYGVLLRRRGGKKDIFSGQNWFCSSIIVPLHLSGGAEKKKRIGELCD